MALSRNIRFVGYIIAIAGILTIASCAIAIWMGKKFGLGADTIDMLGWLSIGSLMMIISIPMGCFWLADRLDIRAGLKTMDEQANKRKPALLPWGKK